MSVIRPWDFSNANEIILDKRIFGQRLWIRSGGYDVAVLLAGRRGWTQEDLADRVGLSARYVGQIERAQASMTITVLGRIANALEVEAAKLVTRPRSRQ